MLKKRPKKWMVKSGTASVNREAIITYLCKLIWFYKCAGKGNWGQCGY